MTIDPNITVAIISAIAVIGGGLVTWLTRRKSAQTADDTAVFTAVTSASNDLMGVLTEQVHDLRDRMDAERARRENVEDKLMTVQIKMNTLQDKVTSIDATLGDLVDFVNLFMRYVAGGYQGAMPSPSGRVMPLLDPDAWSAVQAHAAARSGTEDIRNG